MKIRRDAYISAFVVRRAPLPSGHGQEHLWNRMLHAAGELSWEVSNKIQNLLCTKRIEAAALHKAGSSKPYILRATQIVQCTCALACTEQGHPASAFLQWPYH